jgi:molybdenum cofactor cytidylyltransferase
MGKIIALVLAAGFSRRMKRNKMLLPFSHGTVIENTVRSFFQTPVAEVAVVVGHQQDEIRQVLASYPVRFIENPNFPQGMSTSVQEGIKVLGEDPQVEGVLITPGDMPLIKKETVGALIEKFREGSYSVIIPVYQGKKGHPVFFARTLFPQLGDVSGDVGAREVVRKNQSQCCFVEVDDPGILIDIDCPEEYERWSKVMENRKNNFNRNK